ncbi:Phosphatidate cytidylyltransferase [Taphrina deformans PYCC 5710]|uniref:Phosphatidate cytidylyltransferase n=1 Tax=Taphrina deformans (strain PYCC 5710 / ATCC 11124 / CBS 356.35 / IMI 108563 / JCM 9778 / NBRC 8474) TaxID=1097556 RepID=R4X948_TAPDE|nr:Phosphatidate cytidylyltransferase [Taphrina deformans PYCC 5710]|eukprot:CCG81950.1 Phosphatidate cytidylyltransferase [Taphrina deformans PYCC 5710]
MSQRKRKSNGAQSPPSSPTKDSITNQVKQEQVQEKPAKSNAAIRTTWTAIMIGGLLALLAAGHLWIILFLTVVQVMIFNEILAIAAVPAKENQIPWFKAINWYFLATTLYFAYGETVVYYFKHIVLVDALLLPFATHHRFISFILYIIGFVWFVGSLQKGQYRFQFSQFSFTHMTLILVVGQAHFIINNLLEGIYWFLIPASLVIANDCFAYVCGKLFGKHKLLELSPKKTVEGFLGAWVCTGVIGLIVSNVFMRSDYFICPATDLGANFFTGLQCEPNPVFLTRTFDLPPTFLNLHPLLSFLPRHINIAPIQLHLMVLSTFASLIAPFGGFFASGLKRAFKIKDFGDSIPGHGGMTDRMDCQILNGFFVYLYYQSFIAVKKESVGALLGAAVMGLSDDDIIILIQKLTSYLRNRGR